MIDLETGRTEVRLADTSSYRYQSSYKSMACLKLEHANDDALFERLADLKNLSNLEFKKCCGYLAGAAQRSY
jgi:hypothetical protein